MQRQLFSRFLRKKFASCLLFGVYRVIDVHAFFVSEKEKTEKTKNPNVSEPDGPIKNPENPKKKRNKTKPSTTNPQRVPEEFSSSSHEPDEPMDQSNEFSTCFSRYFCGLCRTLNITYSHNTDSSCPRSSTCRFPREKFVSFLDIRSVFIDVI